MDFIQKLLAPVKKLWAKLTSHVRDYSHVAVEITEMLKRVVESDITATVVILTPTNVDDALLEKLRRIIPQVLLKITVAHNIMQENGKDSDAVEAFAQYLKELKPEGRKMFWVLLAAELNEVLADGDVTFSEAIRITQSVYAELYGNK